MERGATGSEGAIELLLGQREWLGRLAASLAVDAAQADDLVQRTLLVALERPPERASHPRAWLATVVRRLVRADDQGEAQRRLRERRAPAPAAAPPPDVIVAQAALQHEMSAAVLALEEPYRTALLLRFASDLSPRAIAARTDAPVETVRTRIKRGVELVRARLIDARRDTRVGGSRVAEQALAWLGLVEGAARKTVKQQLLASSTVAGGASGVAAAAGIAGALGVIGMSTKVKLAAALVVAAAGTFAVVKLREPSLPPLDGSSADAGARSSRPPEPAAAEPLPEPVAASRAEERERGSAPPPAATPVAVAHGAVAGVVRTERGEPAAGAVVLLAETAGDNPLSSLMELCGGAAVLLAGELDRPGAPQRVVAAADGSFRFADLASGATVNVAALHPQEGTALESGIVVERGPAATTVELTLAAGVVIHGQVTDEQGVPIPVAVVQLHRFARVPNGTTMSSLAALPVDSEGRFRSIPLPFRGFGFDASAPGFLSGRLASVELPDSEREHRADFRLARSRTLRGRLLAPDGTPARLAATAIEIEVLLSAADPRTGIDLRRGDRETAALDREEARWEATPRRAEMRYVSVWSRDALLGAAEIVDLERGADVTIDLSEAPRAPPKATLVVEAVRADDGAAVPDFQLQLSLDPTSASDPGESTTSRAFDGKGGRVEIGELEVGGYELTLRAEGFVPRFAAVRLAATGSKVRFELKPASARLAGRVQEEGGRPLAGARLFLLDPEGRIAQPYPECTVVSDAEGRFAFGKVVAGDYVVVAEAEGFGPASAPASARSGNGPGDAPASDVLLTLRGGAEVTIVVRCGETRVEGPFMFRIRDERGVPVHDDHRAPGWLTTSTGDGFDFRLAPGRYAVEVFCPKYEPGRATFNAAPKTTVRVELGRPDPDREEGR